MKLMVFDVGGTDIKYSVMDESLVRTEAGSVPTPKTTIEDFVDTIEKIYRPHEKEVEGIAMSLPGFIDSKEGVCLGGGALLYNHRQPVGVKIAEKCGCKVRIANDGKCAAVAEQKGGALKGCENAGVFIIGTGVGGGLIIHGKILNGTHFTAGEYSFLRVDTDDWDDRKNTLGMRCSTTGLLLAYRKAKGLDKDAPMNGITFFERVEDGEKEAVDTLHEFCHQVAMQIANLTILLDLEKVAIGGGISQQQVLIEGIQKAVDDVFANRGPFLDVNLPKPTIVRCHYASESNQIGAYYLYKEEL